MALEERKKTPPILTVIWMHFYICYLSRTVLWSKEQNMLRDGRGVGCYQGELCILVDVADIWRTFSSLSGLQLRLPWSDKSRHTRLAGSPRQTLTRKRKLRKSAPLHRRRSQRFVLGVKHYPVLRLFCCTLNWLFRKIFKRCIMVAYSLIAMLLSWYCNVGGVNCKMCFLSKAWCNWWDFKLCTMVTGINEIKHTVLWLHEVQFKKIMDVVQNCKSLDVHLFF